MNHKLTQEIEEMLREKCNARCLDEEEDIKTVVTAINSVVENWISNRCPGCK